MMNDPEGPVGGTGGAQALLRHVVEADLHETTGGDHTEEHTEAGEHDLEDLAVAGCGRVDDEERDDASGQEHWPENAEGADLPASKVCFEHCEQHRKIDNKNVGWHGNHFLWGQLHRHTSDHRMDRPPGGSMGGNEAPRLHPRVEAVIDH